MKTLQVNVANKVATYMKRSGCIVCGNSNYRIQFTFDAEWADYPNKTARFIWNGQYFDQEFEGDTCPVPMIQRATLVSVGVYAGDLRTTTPASIECLPSILCTGGSPHPETGQHYSNEAKAAAEEAKVAAEEAKAAEESATQSATAAEMARAEAEARLNASTRIVQATGDSETAVMSQKAVTDELAPLKDANGDVEQIKAVSYNFQKEDYYVDDISSFEKVDNAAWSVVSTGESEVANASYEYYKKDVSAGETYYIETRSTGSFQHVRLYDADGNGTTLEPNESPYYKDYLTIPEGIVRIIINNYKKYYTAVIEKGVAEVKFTPKADYLYGKRLVACGDSITDASRPADLGGGYFESYAEITAKRHGMIFTKNAVSGSTMAYTEDATNNRINERCFSNTRYLNLPEFDYLTIWFGWNDATYSQLGTIEDADNTTFYGAYKKVLDHLVTNNPTKKIGLVVPYGSSQVEPFAQAVRDISKLYGVPCLDLRDYNECSSFWEKTNGNPAIVARRDALTYDTTHPNQEGHEFLSTMYDNFIKRL